MVEFYLLTFPRFPLRKKEHKSYFFGKNRTHDFRTSRCAACLLDHSGDELQLVKGKNSIYTAAALNRDSNCSVVIICLVVYIVFVFVFMIFKEKSERAYTF